MNKYEKYLKNRKTDRILLIILILSIVFLSFLETYRIFFSDAYYEEVLNFIEVPVLSVDKHQRDIIKGSDIIYKKIPVAYLSEDVITVKDELEGKYVRLEHTIEKNLPITSNQIEDKTNMTDNGNTLLNQDQFLFPVSVNLIKSSGNNIKPSMNVDVYVTVESDESYISDSLLENVRVIGVKDNEGNDIGDDNSDSVPYIILLAIDENYISLMNIAEKTGEIELFIKNDSYKIKKESILNKDSKILEFLEN